jgi:Uncharacterised protein family (UPF0236)
LRVIFNAHDKTGRYDMEATETAVRSAMHQAGAAALTQLLQFPAPPDNQRSLPCPCGHQARYQGLRSKPVLTVVGPVKISRPYYWCKHCGNGQFPADVELDIERKESSPGVRRMEAVVGHDAAFKRGSKQIKELAALDVTTKSVERTAEGIGANIAAREQQRIKRAIQLDLPVVIGPRIPVLYIEMDGTGISVVKKETEGRKGKTAGQPAHTREAKLGCLFTQAGCDEEGYAIRDPDSTTYVGAIETAEEFGKRLYLEAWDRGWSRAEKKVVIGDGAEWIWNLADQHFPSAIQIVDLFHAREHLWELARKLHPNDEAEQKRWMMVHQDLLDNGKMKKLTVALKAIADNHPEVAEKFRSEAEYFRRNAMRMRYPKFRRLHLFVGSGVIEAGCKSVIGKRLKQSGMFWTVESANAIIALRCLILNDRFEDYWAERGVA